MDKLSEFVDQPQPSTTLRLDPFILLFGLGTIVLIIILFSYIWYRIEESKTTLIEIKKDSYIVTNGILVDISGAVEKPGVYTLTADERVKDVLIKAGGLRPEADAGWINRSLNLAATLTDGSKLYIPFDGESSSAPKVDHNQSQDCIVNLNSANLTQLDSLPGIGQATAQKILDHRTEHGNFSQIEDITKVPGIGDKLYSGIKDLICI